MIWSVAMSPPEDTSTAITSENDPTSHQERFIDRFVRITDPSLSLKGQTSDATTVNITAPSPSSSSPSSDIVGEDTSENREWKFEFPKNYRINIKQSGELLKSFLGVLISLSSSSTTATPIPPPPSVMEVQALLNLFISLVTDETNVVRMRIQEQEDREMVFRREEKIGWNCLDDLLECLENLITPLSSSSSQITSADLASNPYQHIDFIAKLLLLFGKLGRIDITTKQLNRFSHLTHSISKLGETYLYIRDYTTDMCSPNHTYISMQYLVS